MKGSLLTSAAMHTVLLGLALFSFGSPPAFEVQDVESLPVDIIPVEEMTQILEGEKKATAKEKPAPTPTKRPDPVQDAQNTGENDIDLKKTPTPANKPKEVEVAAAPEKVENPLPEKADRPNDIKDIIKEEQQAAPATEVAAKPEPKRDVKPDPAPEAKAEETATADSVPLPDAVPLPSQRPEPPKPEPKKQANAETKAAQAATAKTPDRKKDQEKKETAKSTSSKDSDVIADEVAALLNKQDPAGGGAKRSQSEEALGGQKPTNSEKLSQSELDALRGAIEKNWSVVSGMADAGDIRIQVKMRLDPTGAIVGEPEVTATGGTSSSRDVLASSARRAVLRSAPFTNLPKDKYDAWSEVVVNFDPSELML